MGLWRHIFCISNTATALINLVLFHGLHRENKFVPGTKRILNLISNSAVVFHSVGDRTKLEHKILINETKSWTMTSNLKHCAVTNKCICRLTMTSVTSLLVFPITCSLDESTVYEVWHEDNIFFLYIGYHLLVLQHVKVLTSKHSMDCSNTDMMTLGSVTPPMPN